jgi:hypothetical protein
MKIKSFDYSSILGWSMSRYDIFQTCKRQYYYHYYTNYNDKDIREKIIKLKSLSSIPLGIGNIVHETIKSLLERLLKYEGEIDKNRFLGYAKEKAEHYCQTNEFFEIYFELLNGVDVEDVFKQTSICLTNLLESDRYIWITNNAVKGKNDWLIEPPGFGETRINGLKAYCKVDFLFPVNNEIYILDWKTGKPNEEKHRKQLLGYATWATFHFEVDPTKVSPIIAYLKPAYNEIEIEANEYDIGEFAQKIKAETHEMYKFCKNIEDNIPKDKECFFRTDNTIICSNCNYRELCN